MNKLFILLIFLFTCTSVFPQWWVKGGNLIWPYGNVTISDGNFLLDSGDLSLSSGALRLGSSKITPDSLYWTNGLSSQLRFTSDGIEESQFYIRAYSFGQETDAILSMSAANGIDIESPWITIDGGLNGVTVKNSLTVPEEINAEDIIVADELDAWGPLHTHSTAQIDGNLTAPSAQISNTLSAKNVIETSSLEFVIWLEIDEPFTALDAIIQLNEIGSPVDTIIYDNSLQSLVICFEDNQGIDITQYDVASLPVPALVSDDTTQQIAYLTAFKTEVYNPTSKKSIAATLYNSTQTSPMTDFASGEFYLYLKLIPQNDQNASGYQTLSVTAP